MAKEPLVAQFRIGDGYQQLFKEIARYHGTSMTDLLRDFIMEQGNKIAGPFTITGTDKNGEVVSSPIQLRAMEMAIYIGDKLDRELEKDKEAVKAARARLEEKRSERQARFEVKAAVAA